MKTNRKLTLKKEVVTALSDTQTGNFRGGTGHGPDTFHSNCLCYSEAESCTGCPEKEINTNNGDINTICSFRNGYCIPTGICEPPTTIGYDECLADTIEILEKG